jgi:hypothetical protein
MHSRLQRPLSELLRVAVVCSKNFGTVPDDPTGEMPDDGARCGRDCYRALASGWSVTAHRSRHRKGSLFAALAASLKCPGLMSAREAAPTSTPADVSSSFSQTPETRSAKIVRKIPKGAPGCIVETVETRQRNMRHGSRPRLYAARSRSMSSTSPPKLKSSGCAFAHSNRALCHLSSGGTPSSLIQSSPRNTNNSAGADVSRVKKLAGFRVVQRWGWSGWRGRDGLPAAGSRTAPRVVGSC